jgi:hypothetical protein
VHTCAVVQSRPEGSSTGQHLATLVQQLLAWHEVVRPSIGPPSGLPASLGRQHARRSSDARGAAAMHSRPASHTPPHASTSVRRLPSAGNSAASPLRACAGSCHVVTSVLCATAP